MPSSRALQEALLERDFDSLPRAAHDFARATSLHELWTAVTRFAVLAFVPSIHSCRALQACAAAWDEHLVPAGSRVDLLIECARYAAVSRPAWQEPPLLHAPAVDGPRQGADLRSAIAAGDRPAAEQWLAANLDRAGRELETFVRGEAALLLAAVRDLEPRIGSQGRFALLRAVVLLLVSGLETDERPAVDDPVDEAVRERGSIESVSAVLVAHARRRLAGLTRRSGAPVPLAPYRLGRDFAQTLLAHSIAPELEPQVATRLLAAVHENLQHGESFEEWSLA